MEKYETARFKFSSCDSSFVYSLPLHLDLAHKKRRTSVRLFLPQIYHELNLLMLWYDSNIYNKVFQYLFFRPIAFIFDKEGFLISVFLQKRENM
ncbi:hypothetical protein DZ858_04045 [Marixanthomonas ophiurae]|uniref:Uncharacterized protein n=1 Tax=Marixanthomonas ophiurae TaxID=387659 RepID=A0A3E1QAV3_9FLAO|nr:hypothetical protein DZ858_04045 [Marixanthomonas ophiurae]